jgi:hypothetical protein
MILEHLELAERHVAEGERHVCDRKRSSPNWLTTLTI